MKTLGFFLLTIFIISSSFMSITTSDKNNDETLKMQTWRALCRDGSVGGMFTCDCTQAEANAIAYVMCN